MALIGVVYNLKQAAVDDDEPPDSGAEYDSESTVLAIADALRRRGYGVSLIEGDENAYLKLLAQRPDFVFNIAEGLRGESRESHIPAILEMLNIPYSGSGVTTLALTLNKPLSKKILDYHRIPTAKFLVYGNQSEGGGFYKGFDGDLNAANGLVYPVFAKPAHEGSSMGITTSSYCKDERELVKEAKRLALLYKQEVLIEEYLPGREFTVGILGNRQPIVFPILEIDFHAVPEDHGRIYSRHFKSYWTDDNYYLCPAPIPVDLENQIKESALRTYRVLGCRDFARIDLRLDKHGVPNLIEVNPLPGLAPGFSDYPRLAEKAGWSYEELINGILECALRRNNLEHLIIPSLFHPQIA